MRIGFKLMLAITVVIGLAIGAGIGAFQTSNNTNAAGIATSSGLNRSSTSQNGTGGSSQQFGGQQQGGVQTAGRPTMGVVEKVGEKEFSVKEEGSSNATAVRVNDKTAVRKQVTGAVSDIKTGDRIVARGEATGDGAVKATSVQILSGEGGPAVLGMGMQTGGAGGQRRQGNQQGESAGAGGQNAGIVMGVVESIDGGTLTVTQQGGMQGQSSAQPSKAKVSVSESTTVVKMADGSLEDVKEGAFVIVTGPRGADGAVAATTIQILPQGSAPTLRRGQQ